MRPYPSHLCDSDSTPSLIIPEVHEWLVQVMPEIIIQLCSSAKYNTTPYQFWDHFYQNNQDNFFRDRKWLHREFQELTQLSRADVCNHTFKDAPRLLIRWICIATLS